MNDAEGNREQVKTQGDQPGVLTCRLLHRGLRPAHAHEGLPRNLGYLVASGTSPERRSGATSRATPGPREVGVPRYER